METLVPIILGGVVVLVVLGAMVFAWRKDVGQMKALAEAFDTHTEQTLFKGRQVRLRFPDTRIWITRMEDPSCNGPAMIMRIDFSRYVPMKLAIANRVGILGLPFKVGPAIQRRIRKFESPVVTDGLAAYCSADSCAECEKLMGVIRTELEAFAGLVKEREGLFGLDERCLRISLDTDEKPENVKAVYETAVALLKKMEVI